MRSGSDVPSFTSTLGPVIARYLALKEALGRRYANERAVLPHLRGCVRKKSSMSCVHSDGQRPWFSLPWV